MTRNVRLTRAARRDVAEARGYTERTWGEAQWLRYYTAIVQSFDRIAENPDCGQPREPVGPGVRSLPVAKHLIFYVSIEGVAEVVIIRVLHQSRNLSGLRFLDDLDV